MSNLHPGPKPVVAAIQPGGPFYARPRHFTHVPGILRMSPAFHACPRHFTHVPLAPLPARTPPTRRPPPPPPPSHTHPGASAPPGIRDTSAIPWSRPYHDLCLSLGPGHATALPRSGARRGRDRRSICGASTTSRGPPRRRGQGHGHGQGRAGRVCVANYPPTIQPRGASPGRQDAIRRNRPQTLHPGGHVQCPGRHDAIRCN